MKFLVEIAAGLLAWGLGYLDALMIWLIFDQVTESLTLSWTLLFVIAAGRQLSHFNALKAALNE